MSVLSDSLLVCQPWTVSGYSVWAYIYYSCEAYYDLVSK